MKANDVAEEYFPCRLTLVDDDADDAIPKYRQLRGFYSFLMILEAL